MTEVDCTVAIIDDDASFRRSTARLVRAAGHWVQTFDSAVEFLKSKHPETTSCIVLDVLLPGLSGLELQQKLAKSGVKIPLIFITGHGDIPTSVRAMKAGAIEFLTKPFRDRDLLNAIEQAVQRDRAVRREHAKLQKRRECYETLTPRERQVMALVVAGNLNKQIAAELNTVEKTIKFHRAHVMQKMQVTSVAELVRVAASLNI
ncbi:MAG TPA: response regulator [Verrucomicrobiae bacterium]|jgi:FixJ family two-component response regulator|nr:response regulator [Verrucomicrobiae bacterium]